MPSPDILATIALVVAMGLAVLVICRTEPGGAGRMVRTGHHTAVWLDALEVPATARYGPYDEPEPERTKAADDTSPWAVPAVLATIPDALKAATA